MSLNERSCCSTPPKLSSVTSCSELSTPRVSCDVATILKSSLKSRKWGIGRLNFDWDLSEKELCQAEEMMVRLKETITIKWESKLMTGNIISINCNIIANTSTVDEYLRYGGFKEKTIKELMKKSSTEIIWNLLSSDTSRKGPFPVVKEFCQFFLLLVNKAEQGSPLPCQVPVHVRCKLDPQYRQIWQQFYRPGFYKTEVDLAEYIDRIHDPLTQATALIIILEILMENFSPLLASRVLKAIIVHRGTLDFLTHVKEVQLANLLATFITRIRIKCFPKNSQCWKHSEFY